MFMPLGFIGPLKKENEALRKEIGDLREEIASLKVGRIKNENEALREIWDLRNQIASLQVAPLKKENEALRKEIAYLKVRQENFNPFTAIDVSKYLKDLKPASAQSFRSSGTSDPAMLSGR